MPSPGGSLSLGQAQSTLPCKAACWANHLHHLAEPERSLIRKLERIPASGRAHLLLKIAFSGYRQPFHGVLARNFKMALS